MTRERNVGWRIDYVFVAKDMLNSVKSACILSDVMGSDHCPVGINLETAEYTHSQKLCRNGIALA